MKYFHQTRHGLVDKEFDLKPQFMTRGNSVFATIFNKTDAKNVPIFTIRGNNLYPTSHHKAGIQSQPIYKIIGQKVHSTIHNPEHKGSVAIFDIKNHI